MPRNNVDPFKTFSLTDRHTIFKMLGGTTGVQTLLRDGGDLPVREVLRFFREAHAAGWKPIDLAKCNAEMVRELLRVVRGNATTQLIHPVVDLSAPPRFNRGDFTQKRFVVAEHRIGKEQWSFDIRKVAFHRTPRQRGASAHLYASRISLGEVYKRVASRRLANVALLDFFSDFPQLFPDLCRGMTLWFLGTRFEDRVTKYDTFRFLRCDEDPAIPLRSGWAPSNIRLMERDYVVLITNPR